jgi:hypothetical protein
VENYETTKALGLVYIAWVDSASSATGGWIEVGNLKRECALVHSVGWLIHDDDHCKVILPHLTEDKRQGSGEMIIPASAVRSILNLSISDACTNAAPRQERAARAELLDVLPDP